MTYEKALEHLKSNSERLTAQRYVLIKYLAIEALEKQIPKKPIGDLNSVPHYRCPNCNKAIVVYEEDYRFPNCRWCGQAIDWSEEDDQSKEHE